MEKEWHTSSALTANSAPARIAPEGDGASHSTSALEKKATAPEGSPHTVSRAASDLFSGDDTTDLDDGASRIMLVWSNGFNVWTLLFLLICNPSQAVTRTVARPRSTPIAALQPDSSCMAPFTPKPHPLGYVAHKVLEPPAIDGKVQGPGWDEAAWTEEFQDIQGPSQPLPYHSTRVKMLWDDQALYVGAWMDEPAPWANLTLHDDIIFKDNDFEVFLDPDGDNHQYMEFEINALNAFWDLFLIKPYRDGGPPLMSWESIAPSEPTKQDGPTGWLPVRRAVWVDGAVNDPSVTSKGWGVTLAFPWSLLKQAANKDCPPKLGDQWRINFSRVQWRVVWDAAEGRYVKEPADQNEHNWVWSPQWAIAMHQPEYWGYLQFQGVQGVTSDGVQGVQGMGGTGDVFVPDATWLLRSFLMEVYYRQKARWDSQGTYADSLAALDLEPPPELHDARLLVQTTEVSFIATGQVPQVGGQGHYRRLYVNHESHISEKIITPSAAS